MKKLMIASLVIVLVSANRHPANDVYYQKEITGAWLLNQGAIRQTLVIADDYFSITSFEPNAKKFISTYGGTAKINNNRMEGKIEFHSGDQSKVGMQYSYSLAVKNGSMILNRDQKEEAWQQTDEGKSPLTGNWRIIRKDDNTMNPGARKTIKLLSGKRFQWAAINTETGEFFGTGGGNYTFENGKYTENIEFFSRDSSRVGMSLSFDGKVEGKQWFHSGLSSRGDKVNEFWERK